MAIPVMPDQLRGFFESQEAYRQVVSKAAEERLHVMQRDRGERGDLLEGRGAVSWGFTLPTIAPHVLPQVAQGPSPRPGPLSPGVPSPPPNSSAAHIHLQNRARH